MTILWINLAVVFGYALIARVLARPVIINGSLALVRPNKLLYFAALMTIVLVSGLRANIGDTYVYRNIYEQNVIDLEFIFSEKDIGFGFLQMVLQKYVSQDPQILILTTALITNVLIFIVFYMYSRMIELSVYVYITGGLFLVSMNGIRQLLAAAIAFTAINFLIKGDFVKYSLVILTAALIHQSALILLPIYFLVRYKAWTKATVALIVISIFIVIGFEQFSALLFSVLDSTQYAGYEDFSEGGASILRAAVMGTPIAIAYLGRDKLKEIFPQSDYIVNMALIGFVFMVIASQNWIFARMSIYFELYQLILISWIVKVFNKRDQKLIYFGIIVCYFGYYYFENVMNLNILYKSDYLNW